MDEEQTLTVYSMSNDTFRWFPTHCENHFGYRGIELRRKYRKLPEEDKGKDSRI